ncbi:MAG TPA: HAMP domain-containing sensor histidine kinase [Methanoregulaceae archaeon]|nr:HAMP domain-containing sensor histidine kinase [Methanoregulaceae archaeon]
MSMREQITGDNPGGSGDVFSDQKREDEALLKSNHLLNTLFSDTRHDILNQLTILLGYLELSKDMVLDPTLKEFLKREEDAAESIRRQISYTKDLKDVGLRPPEWQKVKNVVEQAAGYIEGLTIKIEISVDPTLEVYADPLFRKIFSNLLENTHIHGKKASFVRISTLDSGNGLTLVFEDDGEGIPVTDKERIFTRLWPGRQDLGLYFVKEVLALTGMTISERGEPGKGARFEIRVPEGGHRT